MVVLPTVTCPRVGGGFLFVDGDTLRFVDGSGVINGQSLGLLTQPRGLATGPDSLVYVSDANTRTVASLVPTAH